MKIGICLDINNKKLSFGKCGMQGKIVGGKLVSFTGVTGLTQVEDAVPVIYFPKQNAFNIPAFMWMHYSTFVVDVEGNNNTTIEIETLDRKDKIRLCDIGIKPMKISSDEYTFNVSVYKPLINGKSTIAGDHGRPDATVIAGSTNKFVYTYTAGDKGINTNGGLRVLSPYSSWSEPKLFDGAIKLVSRTGAKLSYELVHHHAWPYGFIYNIVVAKGRLVKGDKIIINIGSNKTDGVTVQTYIKDRVKFLTWVDIEGNDNYYALPANQTPHVKIIAGEPTRLRIACQAIVQKNKPFTATVIVLDNHYNALTKKYLRPISLSVYDESGVKLVTKTLVPKNNRCLFTGLRVTKDGYYIIKVTGTGLTEKSQSIKCVTSPAHNKLYWGSIHGHTIMSDGEHTMDDYYTYGRDYGLLDFCALSDHDWEIVEHYRNKQHREHGLISGIAKMAEKYYRPGKYVTIVGYEWMGYRGHVNVYFPGTRYDYPVLNTTSILHLWGIPEAKNRDKNEYDKFVRTYKNKNVLLIPHTSHGYNWDEIKKYQFRLVEIYSMWRESEFGTFGTNSGLEKGHKIGFVGGADSHHGRPGQTNCPSKYNILPRREGLAAVYAKNLLRKDIYTGLKTRSCYATSGERILVEFSINGVQMGNELQLKGKQTKLAISGTVAGTTTIRKIELIKNGKITESRQGMNQIERLYVEEIKQGKQTDYYYMRVVQADGEIAWGSPIWVK
jgi:hypothetical protein